MIDITYLKEDVRGSIFCDVVNISKIHSIFGGTNAGWFGIPRQVFCFVDFLGSIAYNNDPIRKEDGASTRKAVRFIEDFFPKHYKPYSNLLVAMWRHGTVHQFTPFTFYAMKGNQKIVVEWSSNRSDKEHNRKVNLKTFKKEGNPNVICLSVNICQLADDLVIAFDNFIAKMEKNQSFKNGCLRRCSRSMQMKNCMNLKGDKTVKKIIKQVFLAQNSTDGILRGDQVEWYNQLQRK